MSGWRGSLILAALVVLCGCKREPLLHDLSEREANKVVTELHGEGIQATKRSEPDGRYSIEVEDGGAVPALRFLEENRLIRERTERKVESGTFGGSREERRFKFERSMSREIETTLERVPGVREARVHLNLPQSESIFEPGERKGTGSASVLLVASGRFPLERDGVSALVGGAAGLSPAAVTVVIHTAATKSGVTERSELAVAAKPLESLFLGLSRSVRWQLAFLLLALGGALLFMGSVRPRAKRRVAPI
ncbi:MAG: hypothetical protein RL417_2186 [Pseudomonadota bacterium]